MSGKSTKLALADIWQEDAKELKSAREKSRTIHGTQDIRSAGDEVEQPVRDLLRRKLPRAYHVGHGHIVDRDLHPSPQLDTVIVDNLDVPVLFQARSGAEYFPYESVYAVGEVKSTYYSGKKYIETFSDTLETLQTTLHRDKTPENYVSLGRGISVRLGEGMQAKREAQHRMPYYNPLFSFMLFVSSGDFTPSQLTNFYASRPPQLLPNIACFLDQGAVVSPFIWQHQGGGESLGGISINPEFNEESAGGRWEWRFATMQINEELLSGYLFGLLYHLLLTHLSRCILMHPDTIAYLQRPFPQVLSKPLPPAKAHGSPT